MHAVIVREMVDPDHIEESKAPLGAVVPRVQQSPGIVSASWMMTKDAHTLNVLVYDSEEAALGARDRVQGAQRPEFVHLESVEVAEVLTSF